MGLFDSIKKSVSSVKNELLSKDIPSDNENRELKKERFIVAGTMYHLENIDKLHVYNSDYRKRKFEERTKIFKYTFINKPVKLIPEPKNKHDRNAIQVIIAGELVGYISRGDNIHVNEILKKHEIKFISSFISGGEYKIVEPDGTTYKDSYNIEITVTIGYV